jgi:hypothetical protein
MVDIRFSKTLARQGAIANTRGADVGFILVVWSIWCRTGFSSFGIHFNDLKSEDICDRLARVVSSAGDAPEFRRLLRRPWTLLEADSSLSEPSAS